MNRIDKIPILFSSPSTGQREIKQDNFWQYQIQLRKWNSKGQVSESGESRLPYSGQGKLPWGGDIWDKIYY